MATFGTVKNKVDCSISVLGTGNKNCDFNIKLLDGMYLLKKGTLITDASTFDKTFLQGLVQSETAISLINAIEFIDDSADDTTEDLQSGTDLLANQGKYKFSLRFKKGEYFNKALSSLNSFGFYDILLVDEAGSFLMTENASGVAKGFKAGRITPQKRKFADGATATSKMITFQLLDRAEQDERLVFLTSEDAGFSPEEVDGINDITASFVVNPANLATTLEVDFISTADNSTALEGLIDANIQVTVDGVVTATTWVESITVPGRYTGTLAALATNEVVIVRLFDATAVEPVILIVDDFYRSNALTETVV